MDFKLEATDIQGQARAGTITLDHGTIQTPIFMPVGNNNTSLAFIFLNTSA